MTHDEYTNLPGLNWSALKNMAVSALAYRYACEHPREDTAALAMGRAIHCAILEPEAFGQRYAIEPPGIDGRTKEGKAAIQAWMKTWPQDPDNPGSSMPMEILSHEQGEIVTACSNAVARNARAVELLAECEKERSIVWTIDGLPCKGRLDAVSRRALIDIKTAHSLEPRKFVNGVASYLYHAQLAWYKAGAVAAGLLDADADVYLLAVETTPSFDCGLFMVPAEALQAGFNVYSRLLDRYRDCCARDEWPGRYPETAILTLPQWAPGNDALTRDDSFNLDVW